MDGIGSYIVHVAIPSVLPPLDGSFDEVEHLVELEKLAEQSGDCEVHHQQVEDGAGEGVDVEDEGGTEAHEEGILDELGDVPVECPLPLWPPVVVPGCHHEDAQA